VGEPAARKSGVRGGIICCKRNFGSDAQYKAQVNRMKMNPMLKNGSAATIQNQKT